MFNKMKCVIYLRMVSINKSKFYHFFYFLIFFLILVGLFYLFDLLFTLLLLNSINMQDILSNPHIVSSVIDGASI